MKEDIATPPLHSFLERLRHAWSARSPFLLFAVKSALAAGLSWEIAISLLGEEAAALAVVSAVIVVQVTSWQTVRKSIERILGVLIGVLLAVLVAHFLGLNIWTITLMVFLAQIVGMLLQNRGQYLATQIPISAALVLVLGASATSYPFLRMLGALIGGVIGTVVSLLLSPPIYVFKARDAIAELTADVADAIPRLAGALSLQVGEEERRELYTHLRDLEQRVHGTEQAYSLGVDSTRLNPWARRARRMLVDYPDVLLAIDRLVRQLRRVAYTINEPEPSWPEIAQGQDWPLDYARLLKEIGAILVQVMAYVSLPTASAGTEPAEKEALNARIEDAQQQLRSWQAHLTQDARQAALQTGKTDRLSIDVGYRLATRGAILTDLRRMLDELHEIFETTVHVSPEMADTTRGNG